MTGILLPEQSVRHTPPDEILSQLGNRIQHVLRYYTKNDEKAIKAAANSFRINPAFDTEEEIKNLATGEALVSFLDEKGQPSIVEKVTILPPQSLMGAITDEERKKFIEESYLYNKYEKKIDEESAFEKIEKENEKKQEELEEEKKKKEKEEQEKKEKKKKPSKIEKAIDKFTNSAISTIGRKIGNSIFKKLFK